MAKKTSQTGTWIVTTSGDRPIGDIARDLKRAGFAVDQVNEEIQSISGKAADDAIGRVRSIAGVADVSPDVPIDVGPPGSTTTW